jgi:hypothetical protein
MGQPIQFKATVYKVQTIVDMGLRITLDLSEQDIHQAAMLMECKRFGVILDVKAVPIVQNEEKEDTVDGKQGRPERKSLRGGAEQV